MRIEARIIAISPIFIGGESAGTIRLPYMIHAPHDRRKYRIEKEKAEIFIKAVGAFYRNCNKDYFGKRSFTEAFRDRVYAALCTSTVSQFFSYLLKHLPVSENSFYQYITKFALGLSKDENRFLLQWARENIDMFVAASVYMVDSYNFASDFQLSDDMLEIESDYQVPVIPGNTIRGLMRDQLMTYVIGKIYGGNPHKCLSAKQYHTLFSGGMLTNSTGFVNVASKREMREKLPFLSILGAMIGNEDLSGKINVNFGKLDCNEFNPENERSGYSYLKEYFMTRKDDFEGETDEAFEKEIGGGSVQMYYSILAIEAGAEFAWSIDHYYLSENEKIFFDLMLYLFQKIGKVGGLSRAGYGKIAVIYRDYSPSFEKADEFLAANQESIKETIAGL